jgi:hypothetical protein
MAKLVVLTEGLSGRSYELKAEKATVGRVDDNAFHLPEGSVSSHHCELTLNGSDVLVKDLNSTNGTFINGKQISEGVLKPGQILRLGQVEMRLENGAPGAPAAARKPADQTRPIPGGVKFDSQPGGRPVIDKAFAPKSNKTNVIFVGIGVGLGVLIIIFLIIAFSRIQ